MRRVIVSEFVSLDGVMEAPEKWHFPYWSDEMGEYKSDELAAETTGISSSWTRRGKPTPC